MRYLRMKKRRLLPGGGGQVVVIPAANPSANVEPQEVQPVFERVTGETTKTTEAANNGKTRITGLIAPYLTL